MNAMAGSGVRKHRGESEWRRLVAEQERSGLSQRAFCEREGLCVQSLTNWRRRLGVVAAPAALDAVTARGDRETAPAFVEIGSVLSRPLESGVRVRLELGAGIVLELSRV